MNEYEFQLWKEVYVSYVNEFHDPEEAQTRADHAVARMRGSAEITLNRAPKKEEQQVVEGQEVA